MNLGGGTFGMVRRSFNLGEGKIGMAWRSWNLGRAILGHPCNNGGDTFGMA